MQIRELPEKNVKEWMSSSIWNNGLPFKPDASINLYSFVEQNILNPEDWQAAYDFLKKNDPDKIPLGRYDLTENGAYATVSIYQTKNKDTAQYEAHRKYIDIQYVADGAEYIELLPLNLIKEEQKYDRENDVLFFESKTAGEMLYADKKHYFVFFPEDTHKPCLKVNTSDAIRKIVVKIPFKIPDPPGIVVDHISKETGKYIGSPGLCIMRDGSYVASHDEFGPESSEFQSAVTKIFLSKDKGETWAHISSIDGQFWSNLFVHNDDLYIMGTNKHHGNFIIRKSTDGGYSWTIPYNKTNGLILEGEYHTAPMPVTLYNGRIWRAVEYATAPTTRWGKRYSAMMVSAPVNADLLKAESWRKTTYLMYDSAYLDRKFGGWLEGNAVVDLNGNMLDILRVAVPAGHEEYAAFVKISKDGKTASFDPEKGFIKFPGGSKKFTIRYDQVTKRYWMLTNYVAPGLKKQNPANVRNRQVLCSSENLKDWEMHQVLLQHPDVKNHGFQYVEWQFEGDDIIFLSRTAFDDETGGANNNHDANFLTFHRIKNFRAMISGNKTIELVWE
jgi:YhcH/YjgK/YiaL family protein